MNPLQTFIFKHGPVELKSIYFTFLLAIDVSVANIDMELIIGLPCAVLVQS
jgi:hypothetical protein